MCVYNEATSPSQRHQSHLDKVDKLDNLDIDEYLDDVLYTKTFSPFPICPPSNWKMKTYLHKTTGELSKRQFWKRGRELELFEFGTIQSSNAKFPRPRAGTTTSTSSRANKLMKLYYITFPMKSKDYMCRVEHSNYAEAHQHFHRVFFDYEST